MANYLNRPSIFEIATAFENGQEGNIQPKKDGYKYIINKHDYYINGYQNISPSEKRFAIRHPYLATRFLINRSKAIEAVKHFEGILNGYGDAIRHCYWCALNQMEAGLNSPLARELGDAHENKPYNDRNSKVMDLHNNSVGYNLGNQAIINEWSEDELLEQVINAANNGKLKILE